MNEYKPWDGPQWVKGACVGRGHPWTVKRVEDRGRTIYWEHFDGRTARTVCTPDHPDYPKDPTEAERRAEVRKALDEKKAARKGGWFYP